MRIYIKGNHWLWNTLALMLLSAALLTGCGTSAPSAAPTSFPTSTARPDLAFTLPATWTAEPSRTPGPRDTATITPSPTITATPLGINNPYLTGVEALLPEGSRPLRERAWRIGGDDSFWGFMILPFQAGDAIDVALLGLPRNTSGGWDRRTIYLLWQWSLEGQEPTAWAEIRQLPYAPNQAERAFLARDAEGKWHAVPLIIGEKVRAGPLLRVANPNEVFLGPVDKPDGRLYVLRDGERVAIYGEDAWLLQELTAPEGLLPVVAYAPPSQVDGSGPTELMLRWSGGEGGPLHLLQRTGDGMALVAEVPGGAQFLEIDGDGFREFLLPDDFSSPTRWEVLRWDGERYMPAPALEMPEPPEAQVVTDWEDLPALPADLLLRGMDGRWAVWPEEGGALSEMTGEPPEPQPCTTGQACRSPDGRYQVTAVSAELEPTQPSTPAPIQTAVQTVTPTPTAASAISTAEATDGPTGTPEPTATPTVTPLPRMVSAIRSGGRVIEIPGTLNYTGTSSFAWAPSGLLMGWAGRTGGLYQVNPATGAAVPLLETALCVPGSTACPAVTTGMGVISPHALPDGAVGFAVQSTMPGQYPPPGIYRRDPDGTLNMLAGLRLLEPYCVTTRVGYGFGQVLWSPDGEAFLYYSPPACLDGIVLLGLTDGSVLYDLSNLPGAVTDIRWGQ